MFARKKKILSGTEFTEEKSTISVCGFKQTEILPQVQAMILQLAEQTWKWEVWRKMSGRVNNPKD